MDHWTILQELKRDDRQCQGLSDTIVKTFLGSSPDLQRAIQDATKNASRLKNEFPDIWNLPEQEQIKLLQSGFVNFYTDETVNPYVAIAAAGPWIISSCGAVIHDSGGYGMLGFGHDPLFVREAMDQSQVMANVMTANFSQHRFIKVIKEEIGHTRKAESCPFDRFLCMNSGSEANSVAMRIADVNAKKQAASKTVKYLVFQKAFHGRTEKPAEISHSSLKKYKSHLHSFQNLDNLIVIPVNDINALNEAFEKSSRENFFISMAVFEPVMGEGNPGQALCPKFYKKAHELCKQHGSFLMIDAIQAGIRAHGYLSIVDYPDFRECPEPDFESYSKALNAGQYPMSVLAMSKPAADSYVKGIYGNTMTTNPRALDVASTVLSELGETLRKNIQDKGSEFVAKLKKLQTEFPDVITSVQGTGLLLCAEINPDAYAVVGFDGLEQVLRVHGIGVIHGGRNALRFTPHFRISSQEIDLIIESMRRAFKGELAL